MARHGGLKWGGTKGWLRSKHKIRSINFVRTSFDYIIISEQVRRMQGRLSIHRFYPGEVTSAWDVGVTRLMTNTPVN